MTEHTEICRRCKGKGHRWTTVDGVRSQFTCGTCHGAGEKTYKASAEKRAAMNAKVKIRKERKLLESILEFKVAYPAVITWMDLGVFPFAVAMRDALAKYGSLTDKQLAASIKCAGQRR